MTRVFSISIALWLVATSVAIAASDTVRCVQNELNDLGYDAGAADGLLGGKTISAGDKYIAYMKANNPGWNMPRLNKGNADHWCRSVASANSSVAKYYEALLAASGASTLTVRNVELNRNIRAGEPYRVEILYEASGKSGSIEINAACFTWNDEGPYCFALEPAGRNKALVNLTTGNPGTYRLNGALRYVSGGKQYMSNWFTNDIVVTR